MTEAAADSSNQQLLQVVDDDDTEILSILLSSGGDVEDLQLVAERFRADHYSSAKALLQNVVVSSPIASVFKIHYEFDDNNSTAAAAAETGMTSHVPVAAFANEVGQQHIAAVMALLQVSKRAATALTLGVMMVRKDEFSSSGNDSIGTIALLNAVTEYYYSQRAARLSIIAELLRMDTNSHKEPSILDDLDGAITLLNVGGGIASTQKQQPRGLFGMLLSAACQPDPALNRTTICLRRNYAVVMLLLLSGQGLFEIPWTAARRTSRRNGRKPWKLSLPCCFIAWRSTRHVPILPSW